MKVKLLSLVAMLAMIPWLGGMLVLGAIAAPTIFHVVPMQEAADAMTLVFRRFDRVAICASVIVLLCEVGLATSTRTLRDAVRSFVAILMSALALYEGTMLSPKIEALHRAGAIRGVDELGMDLEHAHALAELVGKAQCALGVAYVALLVWTIAGTEVANSPSTTVAKGARRSLQGAQPDEGGRKFGRDKA